MKKLLAVAHCVLLANVFALVPDLGHIVRHQPEILRGNPVPLTFDGSFDIDGERARYVATWGGINSGSVVKFEKIPATWATNVSSLWLVRSRSQCTLLINRAAYPCMSLRLWSEFELGGSTERVVQALTSQKLALPSDLGFRAINSKDYLNGQRHESKVVVGFRTLQGIFVATLDYAGPGGTLLSFDPMFYSLLFARMPVEGMTWDLSANPEFRLEKEDSYNNLIISKRIEAREGVRLIAVDRREAPRRIGKAEIPAAPVSRGSVSSIPFDRFSEKGRNFLKLLFLTH